MQKGIDYPGISVGYLCHDGQGNFVMNLRSTKCRDEHGKWDFGGGALDLGDSVEETLVKELKEEYGVEPLSYEFLGYIDLFREHEGKKTHWICLDFLVEVDRSKVINGEPHKFDKIDWFKLDNLPANLHSIAPLVLAKYKAKLFT